MKKTMTFQVERREERVKGDVEEERKKSKKEGY